MKEKRWLWLAVAALAGYFALLILLALAESGHPNASIQSFSDALWYSIVTLSTVGYGDLYPVTAVGKLIGLLFVLLSVGALAFLVGSAVSLLTGQMLPRLQLWLHRGKQWYVFSQLNDTSLALAQSLKKKDTLLLFPLADREKGPLMEKLCYYPGTMASAVALKRDRCRLFFLDEESGSNYTQALSALSLGHPVYCCTEQTPDCCPERLTLFNRYACCARDYWRRHPLSTTEKDVILIGDGRYAWELLEQGLMVNVFAPEQTVRYHVFGNWEDFCCCHPQLGLTLAINEEKPGTDSLLFHSQNWNADSALLSDAHRIILCSDDTKENMATLRKLRRYYCVNGRVHLRSEASVPGETVFGTDSQIFTAENVMANALTKAARTMHQIYRESVSAPVADWEDLSEFTRQSNLAAADHLLIKVRLLLQDESITSPTAEQMKAAYQRFVEDPDRDRYRMIEHLRWLRFHSLLGWRYGPRRDNGARVHPLMLPYASLSPAEQAKDDYAWQLLESMAQKLENDLEDT